jgi:hypothetical protein
MDQIDLMSLGTLAAPMPGLTTALGTVFAEASAVCLEHNRHPQGIVIRVSGTSVAAFNLVWSPVTAQVQRAHHDLQEATERGATCVALHLAYRLFGLEVVTRSAKGTGFDYWLDKAGSDGLFQYAKRLEVSGILNGDDVEVRARLRIKTKQVSASSSTGIPSCVIVVEFGRPVANVAA